MSLHRLVALLGGGLLAIAGALVATTPLEFLSIVAPTGPGPVLPSQTVIGITLGLVMIGCGVAAPARVRYAGPAGVLGAVCAALSLFVAVGGYLIPTILGVFGGVMCAWSDAGARRADGRAPTPPE